MFIGAHIFVAMVFVTSVCGRDFYVGMFRKNDFLMAQDVLFKDRVPFGVMYAKYGRKFNCPITYIRVVDRIGIGRGPIVEIIRGGLRKNLIVLRLTSVFNHPISVNIYIGCENKMTSTIKTTSTVALSTNTEIGTEGNVTVVAAEDENVTEAGNTDTTSDINTTVNQEEMK